MANSCKICGGPTLAGNNYVRICTPCKFFTGRATGKDRNKITGETLYGLWIKQGGNGFRGKCAICGTDIIASMGMRNRNQRGGIATLDRIKSGARGGEYIEGNLRWVCDFCNFYRSDLPDEQLIEWAQTILSHLGRAHAKT